MTRGKSSGRKPIRERREPGIRVLELVDDSMGFEDLAAQHSLAQRLRVHLWHEDGIAQPIRAIEGKRSAAFDLLEPPRTRKRGEWEDERGVHEPVRHQPDVELAKPAQSVVCVLGVLQIRDPVDSARERVDPRIFQLLKQVDVGESLLG